TDTVVSGGGEEAGGAVGDVWVDVDGGDLSGRADQFGDQGGVVTARANLQDTVVRLDAGRFAHHGLQTWCADGAADPAVGRVTGGDDVIGVRGLHEHVRCESMAGNPAQGGLDTGGADVAGREELIDEPVPQCSGIVFLRGSGGSRHPGAFRTGHAGSATVGEPGRGMVPVGAYWSACASNIEA